MSTGTVTKWWNKFPGDCLGGCGRKIDGMCVGCCEGARILNRNALSRLRERGNTYRHRALAMLRLVRKLKGI